MKVLWFEVTTPAAFSRRGEVIGGWQDSLERIVKTIPDLELVVAFVSESSSEMKKIDGVTYVPIMARWTRKERICGRYWDQYVEKVLPGAKRVVDDFKPDLIHVFGMEWPFGQIAQYTDVPVVIHIMGSIVPYRNSNYPPGFSYQDAIKRCGWNLKKRFVLWKGEQDNKNWADWEQRTWKLVENYMGRTQWDESLSRVMHPGRNYFHVDEALRLPFTSNNNKWSIPPGRKTRLLSTGCSTFWKGPDMLLKVARLLTVLGFDFEWLVAGRINEQIKEMVENRIGASFDECHVKVLGFIDSEELVKRLCSTTIFVHTAYIENSPNSICEAQCIGVPVVSTNVGGISSLVRNGVDGILVPANDPWQMADTIIQLSADEERMRRMSENSFTAARRRHDDENIKMQLMRCYQTLVG